MAVKILAKIEAENAQAKLPFLGDMSIWVGRVHYDGIGSRAVVIASEGLNTTVAHLPKAEAVALRNALTKAIRGMKQ
jgi:hypothetical protein